MRFRRASRACWTAAASSRPRAAIRCSYRATTDGWARILPVHHGLGQRRVVQLVVTMTAIADEVDEGVAPELLPVADGEPRGLDGGVRVVGIHVEHRRVEHVPGIGGVPGEEVLGGQQPLDLGARGEGGLGTVPRHRERRGGDRELRGLEQSTALEERDGERAGKGIAGARRVHDVDGRRPIPGGRWWRRPGDPGRPEARYAR